MDTNLKLVSDIVSDIGPLGGLHAGLHATRCQKALVLPADMPLLDKNVLEYLH